MRTVLKDTKASDIPQDWKIARLSEHCGLRQGTYIKPEEMVESGFPVYGANGVIGNARSYMHTDRTVLVSCRGANCGVVHFTMPNSWVNNNSIALEPKSHFVDPQYLYYHLSRTSFNAEITGSAQPQIVVGVLGLKEIVIPPLPEQRKIAEILSTVDGTIEKTDTIIQKTQQLKKGLLQNLLTEGIGHNQFKETAIGRIPEEWEIAQLGDLGEFFKGKTITQSDIIATGLPCIRYGDIYVQYENDHIVTDFSAYISRETAENGRRIYSGDILFAGTGETVEDIGKCVAYTRDDEAYAGGDLIVFRPEGKNQLNSIFLSYCLNSGEVAKWKSRLGQGSSIFHIYAKNLKTLIVPVPSVNEQHKIAEIFCEVDAKIKTEQAFKSEVEQLKKGLMQVLLTGKVRVKV